MTRKRLLQFVNYMNLTRKEFYDSVGFKRGILDADKRKSAVKDTDLAKISAIYPDLNLYWLITGKEQMIRNIEEQTSCDEIKIIAKERAYIIDLQKDKIEMQNKIIEDLILNLQLFKNYNEKMEMKEDIKSFNEIISEPREYELFDDVVKRIKNNKKE